MKHVPDKIFLHMVQYPQNGNRSNTAVDWTQYLCLLLDTKFKIALYENISVDET